MRLGRFATHSLPLVALSLAVSEPGCCAVTISGRYLPARRLTDIPANRLGHDALEVGSQAFVESLPSSPRVEDCGVDTPLTQ